MGECLRPLSWAPERGYERNEKSHGTLQRMWLGDSSQPEQDAQCDPNSRTLCAREKHGDCAKSVVARGWERGRAGEPSGVLGP